jgi:hypothetical protein
MKHNWTNIPDTQEKVCEHGWEPMRKCANCGKVQQRETETSWGRVVKYQWLPLAGRCKNTERGD